MRRVFFFVALVALVFPAAGSAVRLGVAGSKSRFHDQTGQVTQIHLLFSSWGNGLKHPTYFDRLIASHGPVPEFTFTTRTHEGHEAITPRGIARGYGDRYLLFLNHAFARWGKEVIVRPLAEMNGHWNFYCAYNANGTYRGDAHSTKNFRKAFRRIYLVMHGGALSEINPKLKALGMPKLHASTDLPVNPELRVFWNPQGFGSPNLKANSANSYYPGDKYADIVGNDLYDQHYKAEWDANLALLKSHPGKPYAIGEWGLWGIDDPAFVRHMARFVAAHPRVEFISYFQAESGSIFDLGSKPNSRAAYKKYIVPLG